MFTHNEMNNYGTELKPLADACWALKELAVLEARVKEGFTFTASYGCAMKQETHGWCQVTTRMHDIHVTEHSAEIVRAYDHIFTKAHTHAPSRVLTNYSTSVCGETVDVDIPTATAAVADIIRQSKHTMCGYSYPVAAYYASVRKYRTDCRKLRRDYTDEIAALEARLQRAVEHHPSVPNISSCAWLIRHEDIRAIITASGTEYDLDAAAARIEWAGNTARNLRDAPKSPLARPEPPPAPAPSNKKIKTPKPVAPPPPQSDPWAALRK